MLHRKNTTKGLRRSLLWFLFVACLSASTMQAASFMNVVNGVWSTGVGVGGSQLSSTTPGTVDPHYTLAHIPTGCTGVACQQDEGGNFGPQTYVVLGPAGTFPLNGPWLANNANSLWIGPRSDQSAPLIGGTTFPNVGIYASDTDPYVYRTTFNLGALGLDPSEAAIVLAWLSDNNTSSSIRLCAITSVNDPVCAPGTAITGSANAGQAAGTLTQVSIANGFNNAAFTSGLMALDFVFLNQTWPNGFNPSGMRAQIISAEASGAGVPEPGTWLLISGGLIGVGLLRRKSVKG